MTYNSYKIIKNWAQILESKTIQYFFTRPLRSKNWLTSRYFFNLIIYIKIYKDFCWFFFARVFWLAGPFWTLKKTCCACLCASGVFLVCFWLFFSFFGPFCAQIYGKGGEPHAFFFSEIKKCSNTINFDRLLINNRLFIINTFFWVFDKQLFFFFFIFFLYKFFKKNIFFFWLIIRIKLRKIELRY